MPGRLDDKGVVVVVVDDAKSIIRAISFLRRGLSWTFREEEEAWFLLVAAPASRSRRYRDCGGRTTGSFHHEDKANNNGVQVMVALLVQEVDLVVVNGFSIVLVAAAR